MATPETTRRPPLAGFKLGPAVLANVNSLGPSTLVTVNVPLYPKSPPGKPSCTGMPVIVTR